MSIDSLARLNLRPLECQANCGRLTERPLSLKNKNQISNLSMKRKQRVNPVRAVAISCCCQNSLAVLSTRDRTARSCGRKQGFQIERLPQSWWSLNNWDSPFERFKVWKFINFLPIKNWCASESSGGSLGSKHDRLCPRMARIFSEIYATIHGPDHAVHTFAVHCTDWSTELGIMNI